MLEGHAILKQLKAVILKPMPSATSKRKPVNF
jgi:hypothetical protein